MYDGGLYVLVIDTKVSVSTLLLLDANETEHAIAIELSPVGSNDVMFELCSSLGLSICINAWYRLLLLIMKPIRVKLVMNAVRELD
jgi:hypothetical protein